MSTPAPDAAIAARLAELEQAILAEQPGAAARRAAELRKAFAGLTDSRVARLATRSTLELVGEPAVQQLGRARASPREAEKILMRVSLALEHVVVLRRLADAVEAAAQRSARIMHVARPDDAVALAVGVQDARIAQAEAKAR